MMTSVKTSIGDVFLFSLEENGGLARLPIPINREQRCQSKLSMCYLKFFWAFSFFFLGGGSISGVKVEKKFRRSKF
jgi:hypothetical protein